MDQISSDLFTAQREKQQEGKDIQQMLASREQLPVFSMRNDIMREINENSVIVIRGNTGCGKTTQVCTQTFIDNDLKVTNLKGSLFLNVI